MKVVTPPFVGGHGPTSTTRGLRIRKIFERYLVGATPLLKHQERPQCTIPKALAGLVLADDAPDVFGLDDRANGCAFVEQPIANVGIQIALEPPTDRSVKTLLAAIEKFSGEVRL